MKNHRQLGAVDDICEVYGIIETLAFTAKHQAEGNQAGQHGA